MDRLAWRHSTVPAIIARYKLQESTAMSFMRRHFKPYSWVLMISGLPTFRRLQTTEGHKTKGVWKVFYLTYSLACFTLVTVITVLVFYQMAAMFLSDAQVFTVWLYVVVLSVIWVKVVLNVLSVTFKPRNIFHFFDESTRYEASVNFVPPKCCTQAAGRYMLRLLQFLVFVGNVSICTYLVYDFVDYSMPGDTVSVLLKVACLAGNLLFFVYQMSDSIVLRPCVEVLLMYIRQQHEALKSIMDGDDDGSLFMKRDKKVEEVRLSLRTISLLKNQLNSICRWSVMVSGAVVLLLACISIYTAFVEGFSSPQPLLGVFYCVLSVLDILDVAWLSQEMVNEMRSMRQELQNARARENMAYFSQISYLRDTIKPNEMAISGADFFSLNLPLMVSLAGSIITYTVILVQTSESVSTASTAK